MSIQCYRLTLEPITLDVVRIARQAAGISAKKRVESESSGGDDAGVHRYHTSGVKYGGFGNSTTYNMGNMSDDNN